MPLFSRKALVLAKIESTVGTDSVPVVGTDAMLVSNVNIRPLVTKTANRNLLRGYMGGSEQLVVGESAEITFEIEAAGAGTSAVTIPKYAPLMRASGLAGAVISTTSYDYTPISAAFESCTIYCFMDSVRHRITGARMNPVLTLNADGIPVIQYRGVGFYNAPTDVTPGAASFTGWQVPVGMRDSAVPTVTLHSITKAQIPVKGLSIDLGNALVYRTLIGANAALITNRETTGEITFEANSIAVKDWFSTVQAGTTSSLSVVVGTAAFNIFEVVAPKVQLTEPAYSYEDDAVMLTLGMRFLPTNGNDEITFRTR